MGSVPKAECEIVGGFLMVVLVVFIIDRNDKICNGILVQSGSLLHLGASKFILEFGNSSLINNLNSRTIYLLFQSFQLNYKGRGQMLSTQSQWTDQGD